MTKDTAMNKMFNLFCDNKSKFTKDEVFWMIQTNYFGDKNTRKLKEMYLSTYFPAYLSNR